VNRDVLKQIKDSGDIFFAESDRDWVLDGANVHVSMVGFDAGLQTERTLDGQRVTSIAPNLVAQFDTTSARRLTEMAQIHLEGVKKGADFEVIDQKALDLFQQLNPVPKPNSDVVRPYYNGQDLIESRYPGWIIYFWPSHDLTAAASYEAPFELIKGQVFPKYGKTRKKWWLHERPRPEMGNMLANLDRYLVTVKHSKYRLFVWLPTIVLVSNAIEFFAREDDFLFGVLQSHIHELWGLKLGTRLETRPRYTPTTCFETFPFPHPTAEQEAAIAAAAKELDQLRSAWLSPPEWAREEVLTFPGSMTGPWKRYVSGPDSRGIGTVRYPRLVPKDEDHAKKLAARTLTNLYNERPTWLDLAHRKLDKAVFAAYGWKAEMSDEEILERLLKLNLEWASQ
jgi:hypothetical protein